MIVDYSPNFSRELSCTDVLRRRNGKRADICPNFRLEKKTIFVPSLVLPAGPLQALTPVNARVGPLARLLLFFTVTIMLLQIFTRHGELRLDVAFEFGLMGGSGRSAIVLSGSLAMISSVLQGSATVAVHYREDIAGTY